MGHPWKQRKLGDISNLILAGGDVDKEKLKESGRYPVFANALSNEGIIGFYEDEYRVEAPAITVTGRGDIGHAKARKENFTPVVRLLSIITDHDVDFMENAINKLKIVMESTGVPQLTAPQLSKYEVSIPPTIKEEKEIGVFLLKFDDLITLHQRKLDLLKEKKKGLLQKMFPKPGENKPELRFSGFTDPWKQRKLGERILEVTRTDVNSDAPVMMITANDGFINQSERYSSDNAGQSLKRYILLKKGELAYNHGASKLRPYGSCFALQTEEKARIPFVYHCFSTIEDNPAFLSLVLNGNETEKQLRKLVSSGARMDGLLNISFEDYSSILIRLPEREEQDEISNFFYTLDHLITLHQRKLDLLKEKKKGLLQKMFPKPGQQEPELRFSEFR